MVLVDRRGRCCWYCGHRAGGRRCYCMTVVMTADMAHHWDSVGILMPWLSVYTSNFEVAFAAVIATVRAYFEGGDQR